VWQTSYEMEIPSFQDMKLCHIQEKRKPQLLLCESPEPIRSSLLTQVSSSNTVFWNSLSLCCSLGVRDEVPHPYKLEKRCYDPLPLKSWHSIHWWNVKAQDILSDWNWYAEIQNKQNDHCLFRLLSLQPDINSIAFIRESIEEYVARHNIGFNLMKLS